VRPLLLFSGKSTPNTRYLSLAIKLSGRSRPAFGKGYQDFFRLLNTIRRASFAFCARFNL